MKKKLKLILPNKKYAQSFLNLEKQLNKEKYRIGSRGMELFKSTKDFPTYNKKITDDRKGINLEKGRIPATLFWAVVGNKVVGRLDLRHFLNKKLRTLGGHIGYVVSPGERGKGYAKEMLRIGLKKAKKLGIKKALLTCDKTNLASKAVILANGGIFENKFKHKEGVKLRFWIDVR